MIGFLPEVDRPHRSRLWESYRTWGGSLNILYDKSQERDNCGFGLIAHIEGEPRHKVVRTTIHALARMQYRGAILADGKTGDCCGLLLQKPDHLFRMVARERG